MNILSDVAVLIARAESRGVKFRVQDEQVEAKDLNGLPDSLVAELTAREGEVLCQLSGHGARRQDKEIVKLLAWATDLAERVDVLQRPIVFVEAPRITVTTAQVSWYAAHYLETINSACINQQGKGWHIFTPEWWREREQEAIGALTALRRAMERQKRTTDVEAEA